jgi:molecular chaperone DnaJ
MQKRDYYQVLGVSRDAGEGDLKRAYRKLAMENHPDRNPGDKEAEERFKEAAEAYDVLRDREKREIYDRFGHQGLEGSGFRGFSGFEDIFSSFSDIFEDFFGFGTRSRSEGSGFRGFSGFEDIFSSFSDIFEDFFGFGTRSRSRVRPGNDLRYDLEVSLEEAFSGKEEVLAFHKWESCEGSARLS